MGYEGSFSPDGKRLAYVPLSRAFTAWKRYRGGQTTPDLDRDLSDSHGREGPARELQRLLARCGSATRSTSCPTATARSRCSPTTRRTKKVTQAVANTGIDFKSASAGPDAIVVEQFGPLHLFDLKPATPTPVTVTVCRRPAGGAAEIRQRRHAASPTRTSRPPARARSSKRAARSSPCPPRRATRATSPTRPA